MKKQLMIGFAILAVIFSLTSCDKDHLKNIDPEIQSAFDAQYPKAKYVKWEIDDNYYVADFKDEGFNKSAWYSRNAQWMMTEIDDKITHLPQAVQTAFNSSEYASWRIDDVDIIERPEVETIYIIEVEQGEREADLYYLADGILLRIETDANNTDNDDMIVSDLPTEIIDYLNAQFPNVRIVDIESHYNYITVEIIDSSVEREITFTNSGEWVSTSTEIAINQVPGMVMDAFHQSQYATYPIDEVHDVSTPTTHYYLLEVEVNDSEIDLKISEDGIIL